MNGKVFSMHQKSLSALWMFRRGAQYFEKEQDVMRIVFMSCLLSLILVLQTKPGVAGIYTYTDRNGTVHYVDDLSKIPSDQKPDKLGEDEATNISLEPFEIEYYFDETCELCIDAENFLISRGYKYRKYDTRYNREDYDRLMSHGKHVKIPFFVIGTDKIEGFNKRIEARIDMLVNYYNSANTHDVRTNLK